MKTYIFAIGGTGARVLRSLTMLLASGAKGTETGKEIVPVIIDYDGDNGDTKRTQDILENYQKIHNSAYGKKVNNHEEHFFCTPLVSLANLIDDEEIIPQKVRYGIPLEGMDKNTTYSKYIDYGSLTAPKGTLPTRTLLESLYSIEEEKDDQGNENLKAELHMKLYHGFRGCPNIGCVVTKQLTSNAALEQLPGLIQEGDRVFIIGSIFGGTGASGIPMLLDFFKTGNNQQAFANTKVGVLAVTPYFQLTKVDDEKSPIDSNTFIAKTKAALKAYKDTVYQMADAVYMVGDDKVGQLFENIEGGLNQQNNAHIVELVGAMMALDFTNRPESQLDQSFYEFGLRNNHDTTTPFGYDDFYYDETAIPYFDPLARFVIFKHFCENFAFNTKKWEARDLWGKNTGLDSCGQFKQELEVFFGYFKTWIQELENKNYRPFKLFNLEEDDYNKLLEYQRLKNVVSQDKIRTYLSDSNGDPSKKRDGSTNAERYANHPEELFFVNSYNAFEKVQNDIKENSDKGNI